MPAIKKGVYVRQFISATFIAAIPFSAFLHARYDYVAPFIMMGPVALLLSVVAIFLIFVSVYRAGISWVEVLAPILLLGAAVAYVLTGHPYTLGRNTLFRSFEEQFDELARTASIESANDFERLVVPRDLADAGITLASGKRYDDDTILVFIMTGGAGGFAYTSNTTDRLLEDLDRIGRHRWRVGEHWEAFKR